MANLRSSICVAGKDSPQKVVKKGEDVSSTQKQPVVASPGEEKGATDSRTKSDTNVSEALAPHRPCF